MKLLGAKCVICFGFACNGVWEASELASKGILVTSLVPLSPDTGKNTAIAVWGAKLSVKKTRSRPSQVMEEIPGSALLEDLDAKLVDLGWYIK